MARRPFVATGAWEAFLAFAGEPVDDVDAALDGDLLVLQADYGRPSEAERARLGITLERLWGVSFSRQLFDHEGDLREIRVDVVFAPTPALDALEPQWPLFGVGGPGKTDDWAAEVKVQPAFRTPFADGQAVGAMVTGAKPHLV